MTILNSIKFVIFDFDGVFTDGKVYFDNKGNIQKYYNVIDGMGIKTLLKQNIEIGVISGYKKNSSQKEILKHLNIKYISFGNNNKLDIANKWCKKLKITLDDVAFMGDDINDVELMKHVKLTGCPKNAHQECLNLANYVSNKNGGEGCIRDFCEYIDSDNLQNNFDFKTGNITAVVAVRKGSVRCTNKNTKPFGDSNLLTLKLKILKEIPEIKEIIVTTDCEISKLIAKHMNVTVKDRPEYYCSDKCSGSEMLNYIASQCSTEHILYSPVTSPFICKQDAKLNFVVSIYLLFFGKYSICVFRTL